MTAVVFVSAAVLVAAPELIDLAAALRGTGGRHRRHVSRWWLTAAVAVPHLLLVPAAILLGGAS